MSVDLLSALAWDGLVSSRALETTAGDSFNVAMIAQARKCGQLSDLDVLLFIDILKQMRGTEGKEV
jgi:hypothetical protein